MTEVFNLSHGLSRGLSRRSFLKTSALAGGGLLLGVYLPQLNGSAHAAPPKSASYEANAFVRIGSDESITVIAGHSEMGQGVYTGLAMLVAEELDADWTKVRVESAPTADAYKHTAYGIQMTGGSSSTWSEWDRMRKAGAAARKMLLIAASEHWRVPAGECSAENGQVIHAKSNRKLSYGALAERASHLTVPQDAVLKDPKDFKLIGKSTKRVDTPEKVNGKGVFGLDVTLPGMLVAVVARSPVFGGKVKSFNADKAKAISGVRHVVQIDRGIAVVADGYWQALKGRDALTIDWDEGPLAGLDSIKQREQYTELAKKPGATAKKTGDAEATMATAAKKLEAEFEFPYLAHACMEPINCVADVRADSCEVWTGSQFQTIDHGAACQESGLPPEKVKLHTTLLGGGFGRRAVLDSHFVREAVQVSKAIKTPVKVIWSREDDMRGGYYRPSAFHSISAGLDEAGKPLAWRHHIVCESFIVGTPFEAMIVKDGIDETAVEGAADLPYAFPNLKVDWHMAPGGVPCLWLRSVGHTHNAFVTECFLDEVALAAGKEPVAFRRSLLADHPRHLAVLNLAVEKAGWGKNLMLGRGRGVAVHESFGSYVAHVVEASVTKDGQVTIHRVVCAIDCGMVVNPDIVKAQLESAAVFGLTAALYGQITFENGRVKQRNFHDYQMLRMNEMPVVEAYIVPSTEKLGGVGEPGVPSVAPALANAVFALTGKRVRRLPIRAEDIRKA